MHYSCPRCASNSVVAGKLLLSGTDSGCPTYFYPDGIRLLALRKHVSLTHGQEFRACTSCGLTWNELDTQELAALLEKSGTGKARPASDNDTPESE